MVSHPNTNWKITYWTWPSRYSYRRNSGSINQIYLRFKIPVQLIKILRTKLSGTDLSGKRVVNPPDSLTLLWCLRDFYLVSFSVLMLLARYMMGIWAKEVFPFYSFHCLLMCSDLVSVFPFLSLTIHTLGTWVHCLWSLLYPYILLSVYFSTITKFIYVISLVFISNSLHLPRGNCAFARNVATIIRHLIIATGQ